MKALTLLLAMSSILYPRVIQTRVIPAAPQNFIASAIAANPSPHEGVIGLFGSRSKQMYPSRVLISCTAACTFSLDFIQGAGEPPTGCSAVPLGALANLDGGILPLPVGTVFYPTTCAGGTPDTGAMFLPATGLRANSLLSIDLSGTVLNSGAGLMVINQGNLNGNMSVTVFFSEK